MAEVLTTRFQMRRGYAEAWERNNPILAPGEPGWTLDTCVLKIGDGSTPWNSLSAAQNSEEIMNLLTALNDEIIEIKQTIIPNIKTLIETETKRAKEAEDELDKKIINTNKALTDLATKIDANQQSITAILSPESGVLKQANDYTDKAIADLETESGHGVDGDTIKLKDNRAYIAKVSTDVLEQGELILILNAGSSNI